MVGTYFYYNGVGDRDSSTPATSRWDTLSIPPRTAASWESLKVKPAPYRRRNSSVCARRCTVWTYRAIWQSKQRKAKGIQKHYVNKHICHGQFREVLRHAGKNTMCRFRAFRSTNHVVNTVQMTKLCLCAFDDKRYIMGDGMHTLAYGHYSLRT